MNFFKELFQYLFHKNNVLSKKLYTLGAVIVTTCFVSICILGANGNIKSLYGHATNKDEVSVSDEIEQDELDILASEEDDIIASSIIPKESQRYNEYIEFQTYLNADNTVETKKMMKMEGDEIPLSTSEQLDDVSFDAKDLGVEATRLPISISQKDYDVLLKIVEAEAGGEDLFLRTLIANVVINRMQNDYYPNTIEEVVFQNDGKTYQFTPIKDQRYYKVTVSETTIIAVNQALAGYDNSNGALAFVDPSNTSDKVMSWFNNNLDFVLSYGDVSFYSF